jgi:GNAT superfamily N-acetyltransferase
MNLQVLPSQERLVAPAVRSLAQAAYNPAGRALALYDGETVVGMMLLYDMRQDDKTPAEQLYVWRLMVDAEHQGRGIGSLAIQWVVEEARRQGLESVGLSHVDRPGAAGGFYERLGFRYTGEVDEGELKMVLALD